MSFPILLVKKIIKTILYKLTIILWKNVLFILGLFQSKGKDKNIPYIEKFKLYNYDNIKALHDIKVCSNFPFGKKTNNGELFLTSTKFVHRCVS